MYNGMAFFRFLNWGWFAALVGLAAVLVPLFPFEDISFDYIMRKKVFIVMGKTVMIAAPTVTLVGLVAYGIYLHALWKDHVLKALTIHLVGGLILPFGFVLAMIKLLYGDAIFDHPMYQTDLIFVVFLLLVLNFWMRVRIEVVGRNKAELQYKCSEELVDKLETEQACLEQAHSLLSAERSVLWAENQELEMQAAEAKVEYERLYASFKLLQQNLEELKEAIGTKISPISDSPENPKLNILEFECNRRKVFLTEHKVSYAEGRKSDNKFTLKLVDRNKTVYYPPVQSLRQLGESVFTNMLLLSRNYGVMPHSIMAYDFTDKGDMKVLVENLEHPIEVSGKYLKRNKDKIIQLVLDREDTLPE